MNYASQHLQPQFIAPQNEGCMFIVQNGMLIPIQVAAGGFSAHTMPSQQMPQMI